MVKLGSTRVANGRTDATTSQRAAQMLVEALGGTIRARAGEVPARTRRVAIAGAHLLGPAVARHIVKRPSVSEMDLDQLVAPAVPTIPASVRPRA